MKIGVPAPRGCEAVLNHLRRKTVIVLNTIFGRPLHIEPEGIVIGEYSNRREIRLPRSRPQAYRCLPCRNQGVSDPYLEGFDCVQFVANLARHWPGSSFDTHAAPVIIVRR